MDWFNIAFQDWNVNHDISRVANFVIKDKITPEQYKEITGENYVA